MRILVTGATGFIGSHLVHGLGRDDVEQHDREAARHLGLGAAAVGVRQLVYLGGLGDSGDQLSEHLRSRRQVEAALGEAGVPVTVLRAALVIGAGSPSWEILRQLVEKLPVLPTGPWAKVRVQPVALRDADGYLVAVAGDERTYGAVLQIGGPDVLTYGELLQRTAAVLGLDRTVVSLPVLPAAAAKVGVRALTDVDGDEAAALVESLGNEVVVTDDAITRLVPRDLLGFEDQVRAAG